MISRGKRALKLALEKNDCTEPPCKKRLSPDGDAGYWCQAGLDKPGLKKAWINHYIGFGVFTEKEFLKGEFLLEYVGKRYSNKEIDVSRKFNQYTFSFKWNGNHIIDATNVHRLCRYVNDEPNGSKKNNASMKLKIFKNYPRLCLFASRNITAGEELRYDYGDDSAPWRNSEATVAEKPVVDESFGDAAVICCVCICCYHNSLDKGQDEDPFGIDVNDSKQIAEDQDYDPKHNKAESTFESEVDGETLCEDTISEVSSLKRGIQVTEDDDGFEAYEDDDDNRGDDDNDDISSDDDNNSYDEDDYNNGDDDDNIVEDDDDDNNSDDDNYLDLAKDPDYDPKHNKAESTFESEVDGETLCEDTISEVSSLKRGIQVTEDDDGFEANDDDEEDDDDNRGDEDNRGDDDISSDDDNNSDDDNYLDLAKDPDYDPKHNKAESTFESEVDGETLCEDTISEVSSLKRGIQVTEDDDGFEAYDDDDDEEGDDDNNGYDNNDYNNGDDDDNNVEDDDDYNNNDDDDDSDLAKDPDYDPKQNKAESMSESEADSETLCEDTISEGYLNSNYVADSMESGESDSSETFPMLDKQKKIIFQGVQKNLSGNIKNKLHACLFCGKTMPNIARHLELIHKNESEVAKVLTYPKRTKERRKLWEELVNKGDFAHNISVLDKGHGMIIPKKRTENDEVKSLVPCHQCKALYRKKELWKHSKYCIANKGENDELHNPVKMGKLLLPIKNFSDAHLAKNVLAIMRDDNIKLVISHDKRILEYGKRLFDRHGHEAHKIHYISQKLRELGRLLLQCKDAAKDVNCIDDILQGTNWDLLISCVKKVAGYDQDSHSYKTPSLALKIGQSLQKCAGYLRSEGIKEADKNKIAKAESFMDLYKSDWNDEISGHDLTTIGDQKYNKPLLLPVVEDVVKLNTYLTNEVKDLCKNIQKNSYLYARLAQVCLALVILFNRRRSGEAERMTLKGFTDAIVGSGKPDPVVMSTLSEFEKELCKTHTRVEIKGKRGRKVAVLLTEEMKENIKILVAHREKANVINDLLFSKPGETRFPYRGSDCLRKFSIEAGVKNPSALTSTKLRKQLATLAQILNLSETSQDILATFQGHDIRIHREYYRLPEDAMQIAKVSKILHTLNEGNIAKYKGKDFDEIQMEDKATLESESNSDEILEDNADDDFSSTQSTATNSQHMTIKSNPKKLETGQKSRHHWSSEEKSALKRQFKSQLASEKTPGQIHCLNAIRNEPCLSKFNWKQIKFAVKNLITTNIRCAERQLKEH